LLQWAPEGIEITLRMNENVSLLIKGYMAFAIAFQFPMVVLVLVYLDLLSPATLRQYRKFAVVGIAFLSALFTPPEPISMIIMMVPLYLLYEISIWASYLVIRRREAAQKPD
jgi:sec-independent protein translocase protein TatC